jgi:hypothetical protein
MTPTKQEMLKKIYEGEEFVRIFWWYYEISNYWRVYVNERIIANSHWATSKHKWHFYNYAKSKWKWCPKIKITHSDWTSKMYAISRLVMFAFEWFDITNTDIFICHKDDDVNNNKLDNLFLWDVKINNKDRDNKMRMLHKLSLEQVEEIRNKYIPHKYHMYKLAEEYWVAYFTIYAIIKWISWKC